MWNLFCFPTKKETIEAWAKMLEDFAKVAVLAIPVLLFGKEGFIFKSINAVVLLFIAYWCLIVAKVIRERIRELSIIEEDK